MASGVRYRTTLSLLIATGLVVGVHGSASPARGSRIEAYRCCCTGECHCTGDCCNHGPDTTRAGQPPRLRDGAGPPAWRDAERCGVWLITLQRAPGSATALPAGSRRHVAVDPDHGRLRSPALSVLHRQTPSLAPSSPRAPPLV